MFVNTHIEAHEETIEKQEKFLIVPIFFRRQIEALLENGSSPTNFGFFFGEEQEKFSIIKKIWSASEVPATSDRSFYLSIAQQIALESGLKLLGSFAASNNDPGLLDLQLHEEGTLSNIQLIIENGVTQDWIPLQRPDWPYTVVEQKIIL